MTSYKAPIDDIRFVTQEVLDFPGHYQNYPAFAEATPDLIDMIMSECAKFSESELAPLYQSGDKEGCDFNDGVVTTPSGFKDAYKSYTEGGWQGLSHPTEYGGQGLPSSIGLIRTEMICTANWSWAMYSGLSLGAMNTLLAHANEENKQRYLPKLTSGEWTGTMCLTESHCGTDLAQIRTKAVPNDDDSYAITGSKIFISAGDHDLTENIIHIVLAKLPDAPSGTKGISLFIVPKVQVNEDSSLGESNNVVCGSIEEKMGIKASSTAVLNFDGSKGYLIGEPNRGLEYMFTFMNTARVGTAMQGVASAELAYQASLPYAKERLSMRSLTGTKNPDGVADPLIVHPDVRRMLLIQKAISEGGRAMIFYTAKIVDQLDQAKDNAEYKKYEDQ